MKAENGESVGVTTPEWLEYMPYVVWKIFSLGFCPQLQEIADDCGLTVEDIELSLLAAYDKGYITPINGDMTFTTKEGEELILGMNAHIIAPAIPFQATLNVAFNKAVAIQKILKTGITYNGPNEVNPSLMEWAEDHILYTDIVFKINRDTMDGHVTLCTNNGEEVMRLYVPGAWVAAHRLWIAEKYRCGKFPDGYMHCTIE